MGSASHARLGVREDHVVAAVTATLMKANRVMVVGSPMACPRIWSAGTSRSA